MANYWAIAVGINQYPSLQPLMYAQRDAQVLREFLIKEAQFSPQQCFLLTDASPQNNRTETLPSRDSILACIARTCQQRVKPGDFLWFFFSGYGMRFQGKDYLMPIDANPDQIETTGIPIELLFSLFETAPTQNILLLLDVNRGQTLLTEEGVGDQTALLAREHGIPTLLSCAPNQVAHETLTLRQGLFTAAILESLRQGCVTLDHLAQYLIYRLPEFGEEHWRPRQDPLVMIPSEKRYQLIVPEAAAILLGSSIAIPVETVRPSPPSYFPNSIEGDPLEELPLQQMTWIPYIDPGIAESDAPSGGAMNSSWQLWGTLPESMVPDTVPPELNPFQPGYSAPRSVEPDSRSDSDAQFWRKLLIWSSMIAVALLAGVLLRNIGSHGQAPSPQPTASAQSSGEGTQEDAAVLNQIEQINQLNRTSPAAQEGIDAEPGSDLEAAYLSIRSRNYAEAKEFLKQIPQSQHNNDYNKLLEQANRGVLSDAKGILTRTRQLTTENQASDFVDAIGMARKIREGEPMYQEAQGYIDRWSRVLLDMAQGRADRRNDSSTSMATDNYNTAIKTAKLIPQDSPEVYKRAREAINHWSQKIFDLAKARAAEAKYDVAVQTAEVIPPDAAIYPEVQVAIDEWEDKPTLVVAPTPE